MAKHKKKRFKPCYIIMRFDTYHGEFDPTRDIATVAVHEDFDKATAEAVRLNNLKADSRSIYWVNYSRLYPKYDKTTVKA